MATLIAESLAVEEDDNGLRITEVYRESYSNLTGGTDTAKVHDALSATNVPALGAAHALDATVKCVRKAVVNHDGTVVDVQCDFEVPRGDSANGLIDTTGIVRFRGGVVDEETIRDKNDAIMKVSWQGNFSDVYEDFSGIGIPGLFDSTQVQRATVQRPQFGFEITRRFTGGTALSTVAGHATTYIGLVNSLTWTGTVNFNARTCLCTDIQLDVKTEDELHATYSFEYRPETWDFEGSTLIFGRVPANADKTTDFGLKDFEVYSTTDFNSLPVNI